REATDIPYSQFKAHVSAGEIAEVRFDADRLDGVPTGAARAAGAPALWTTEPVADGTLVALLDAHHVEYRSASSWTSIAGPVFFALCGVGLIAFAAYRLSK